MRPSCLVFPDSFNGSSCSTKQNDKIMDHSIQRNKKKFNIVPSAYASYDPVLCRIQNPMFHSVSNTQCGANKQLSYPSQILIKHSQQMLPKIIHAKYACKLSYVLTLANFNQQNHMLVCYTTEPKYQEVPLSDSTASSSTKLSSWSYPFKVPVTGHMNMTAGQHI